MSTHSISRLLLPALLLTPFALPAQTVMNIDFGRNDNQTAENWNNVTGSGGILDTPSVALIDDGGNPTGITLVTSFAGGGSFAGLGADFAGPYPAPFDTAPAQARADSLFKRGASVTFTLTGLIPGEVYELVIYGARGNNGGLSQFTVTDDTGVLPVQSFLNYNNATETATFSGLVPDSNDEITIVFEGVIDAGSTGNNDNERTNGAINAMRVTGSIPVIIDTDMDGMSDGYETDNGTDPNEDGTMGESSSGAKDGPNGALGDKDLDGLTNLQEFLGQDSSGMSTGYGRTLSGMADSDGDLVEDGDEVDGVLNVWDEFGFPDGPPGLPTNPNVVDTDGDGLTDGEEILTHGTDPNFADSDLDTLPDKWEIDNGLDATDGTGDNGAGGNEDMDGLTNFEEYEGGDGIPNTGDETDPKDPDSDDDNLTDGDEVNLHGTDPNLADTDCDLLQDDVEVAGVTDPTLGDTDGDGIKDFIELEAGSNPDDGSMTPTFPAVSWSVAELTSDTQLSTSGSLLYAENYNGVEATVNGITFTSQISAKEIKSTSNVQSLLNNNSIDASIYDDEVPSMSQLIETVWFRSNTVAEDALAVNIGFTGLTPGKSYLIQYCRADDRAGAIVGRWNFVDGFGGNVSTDPIGATNTIYGGSANPALLFTGVFTATSTVQGIVTGQNASGGTLAGSQLSFVQVREIDLVSPPMIESAGFSGVNFEVIASGLNLTADYSLVRSTSLNDGFPVTVDGPRLPSGATDTFTDTEPPAGKAFYRIEFDSGE